MRESVEDIMRRLNLRPQTQMYTEPNPTAYSTYTVHVNPSTEPPTPLPVVADEVLNDLLNGVAAINDSRASDKELDDIVEDSLVEPAQSPQEEDNSINAQIARYEALQTEDTVVREEVLRFSGAEWFKKVQEQTIIVGGAGGISSYVVYNLAKLHPSSIYVYDPDTVETVNLAGQLFKVSDVGKRKVDAVTQTAIDFSGFRSIFALPMWFKEDCEAAPVMICGFDNMQARRTFFTVWEQGVKHVPEDFKANSLFIDGRLAAEKFQIFTVQGNNSWAIEEYKKYLFDDSEAVEAQCSFKQTAFMANMIGSYITNLFVNFCANLCNTSGIDRPLPFKLEYSADNMFLITEE